MAPKKIKTNFTCIYCGANYTTKAALSNHLRQRHNPDDSGDRFCEELKKSLAEVRPDCGIITRPKFKVGFDGNFLYYKKSLGENEFGASLLRDPLHLMKILKSAVICLLSMCTTSLIPGKFQLWLTVLFSREEETITTGFWSDFTTILSSDHISDLIDDAYKKIRESIESFAEMGSGWKIEKVSDIRIKIGKYDPFRPSSYIPLPKNLRKKSQYIVNVENRDQKCFLYSVLAAKHRMVDIDPSSYDKVMDTVDHSMLEFPVRPDKITEFEKSNQDLSINVIAYNADFHYHPIRVSRNVGCNKTVIDLLLLTEGDSNFHYCAIMDFDGFLRYSGAGTNRKFYCRNCFSGFTRESCLLKHRMECFANNPNQRLIFPKEGENKLEFKHFSRQNKHNWVIYADFESILKPIEGPLPDSSSTIPIHKHVPCSYGYIVIGPEGEVVEEKYHFGLDAVEHFVESVTEVGVKYGRILDKAKPLKMSEAEEREFHLASVCHYCGKEFLADPNVSKGEMKVRDHSHFPPGKYRGASHTKCNLTARELNTVPVVLHNLEGYDMHLLVMAVNKFPGRINVIARNSERFQSMSVNISYQIQNTRRRKTITLRFIDSCNFLAASLETLVKNFKNSGGEFHILKAGLDKPSLGSRLTNPNNETLNLLTRKGHYPYEYVGSEEVFARESLPPREAFSSKLKEEELSEEDYLHAENVWDQLTTKTFGHYHAVYQMTDVYLLAEVFENFRNLCLEKYRLDPCYYLSTPGFSWGAAMRFTEVELELFTHVNKHNFIMSGIRGGLSYIARRHSVANNKYIPDTFDPSRPSTYLMYLDANNLYGWAMIQKLPHSNFRWLTKKEIGMFDVSTVPDDGDTGYILEVDLDYPPELHDAHNDYPLAPETVKIRPEMLSDYSKDVAEMVGHNIVPTTKLVTNLSSKKNYIVHYRTLKFYLEHGMILKRIRRILSFKQVAWLKDYIEINTQRRQQAGNDFEKSLYKLANNSVFGKTLENKQKRISVKLVTGIAKAVKYASLPHADSFEILNENILSVLLKARSVTCDLPTYSGFAILELSKLLMYQFHYNYIKRKYEDRASLLFTDTDSLFYSVQTDDLYADMKDNMDEWFDTSNYDRNSPLYSVNNKQVLGKFKDELGGDPVVEFVGLRSKMYSYVTVESSKQTAKGINRTYVKKHLRHDDYLRCLREKCTEKGSWVSIRSKKHQLTTDVITKSLLSPYDDKRFVLDDGVHTLAHGHCDALTQNEEEADDFSDSGYDSDLEKAEKQDLSSQELIVAESEKKKEEDRKRKWNEREAREAVNRQRHAKRQREWRKSLSNERNEARKERKATAQRERDAEKRKAMSAEEQADFNSKRAAAQKQRDIRKREGMTVEEREEINRRRRGRRKHH